MAKLKASQVSHRFLRRTRTQSRKKEPTVISLFSGCGGMDLGFRAAGYDIRVMVEWDKSACDTLRMNWVDRPADWREVLAGEQKAYKRKRGWWAKTYDTPHFWWQERPPVILQRDITKTSTKTILRAGQLQVGEADVLTGGFPCQGFSVAGKRVIDDPRNKLYKECIRVLREALPRTFCFENVPGLVSMDQGRVIKQISEDFAASGYNLSWDVLNAADYGVPQNRKRVFFLGQRIDAMAMDFADEEQVPKLFMGAYVGEIQYPTWFVKKYPHLSLGAKGMQQRLL